MKSFLDRVVVIPQSHYFIKTLILDWINIFLIPNSFMRRAGKIDDEEKFKVAEQAFEKLNLLKG